MTALTPTRPYMRLQDRVETPPGDARLGVDRIVGIWRHTDPQSHGIAQVRVVDNGDGLSVEISVSGGPAPGSYPPAPVGATFAASPVSRDGMAFFVDYDYGFMQSRLQGNANLGLLVLAGFHDFPGRSAYSNYFSREFFYSDVSGKTPSIHTGTSALVDGDVRLDHSSLLGRWRNTNASSAGIVSIEIYDQGDVLGIRAFGAGETSPLEWGETTARTYAKDWCSADAMAFSACFAFDAMSCHFQANVKQGVLVVAYFTIFHDGSGRSNYFSREFYYKEA
jgi:hypothetical protein